MNKYQYLWVIQGNYGLGYGWEDLSAYERWLEARSDLIAYRENEPSNLNRVIRRRVLNEI